MENMLTPALLNGRDCSADFLENIADNGKVVRNNEENNQIIELFFLNNYPIFAIYSPNKNFMNISFTRPELQKKMFLDLIYDEIFDENSDIIVKTSKPTENEKLLDLFFYMA